MVTLKNSSYFEKFLRNKPFFLLIYISLSGTKKCYCQSCVLMFRKGEQHFTLRIRLVSVLLLENLTIGTLLISPEQMLNAAQKPISIEEVIVFWSYYFILWTHFQIAYPTVVTQTPDHASGIIVLTAVRCFLRDTNCDCLLYFRSKI